ncbi:unnamed protein product [Euphydryas editha]|uniref:Uncharacterized protein n=1 Tax=Euphydryas editha TaxID=104508 RepID=A0AAU9U3D4_EUPED|nr:unnamed protein product [Euphydryas editha]
MITTNSALSDHEQIYLEIKKVKPPPKIHSQYKAVNYTKLLYSIEKTEKQKATDEFAVLEKIKIKIEDRSSSL